MLRTFSIVASPPTHQPPSLKPNQKAMRSILMKGHSHSWNTTATATSCFPTPKITTLPSGSPTTASVSAPTVATTAPFGAAMSQASPLNPQTNSLFYLFFSFCDKKILNYFDLVSTGDSMILITGSPDQTAKIWNVQIGEQLYSFKARRFVEFDWT